MRAQLRDRDRVPQPPHEERVVRGLLHDLLLQPPERPAALAVHNGDVDAEDAHERVRLVFDPRRLPLRRPREPLRSRDGRKLYRGQEHINIHARNLAHQPRARALTPQRRPPLRQEHNIQRRNKFLEGPPAREPPAPAESRRRRVRVVSVGDVLEEGVADVRTGVPGMHRVDRLGELRAARLVDAARVDPRPLVPRRLGERAEVADLGARERARVDSRGRVPEGGRGGGGGVAGVEGLDVLEGLLGGAPDVGEDGVDDSFGTGVVDELGAVCSEEPHAVRCAVA